MNQTGGIIVLDKGPGMTSFAALAPVKRVCGKRIKVGHAGTLDPFATGVLIALCGDATRLSNLAMALEKTYEAEIRFGVATDTLDPDGAVVSEANPGPSPPADLEAEVARFEGEIDQIPPAWSALKIDGRRAYSLARKGEEVALEARRVVVHEIRVTAVDWPSARLHIRCGAGTYIRAIARDLGEALGLPASLSALRRTAIGPFTAEDGLRIVTDEEPLTDATLTARLLSARHLTRAAGIPEVRITIQAAHAFGAGQPAVPDDPVLPAGTRVAVIHGELLLGLGESDRYGHIRPTRVFAAARSTLPSA